MSSSIEVKSLDNKVLCLKKIGIIYNVEHTGAEKVIKQLEDIIASYGLDFVKIAKQPHIKSNDLSHEKDIIDESVNLAIVIGGDGTILSTARLYAESDIPVFGINVGRLGFLSQLRPEDMENGIEKLIQGQFKIEDRLMIKAFNNPSNPDFMYTALNDVVIKGGAVSRMAQLFLYINGKHVCDYLADGLIISTPTGSTAYTLSAGGPVLVPELEAIVIAPICPHALTTRPIIIPATDEISVKVHSDSDLIYLTADGQENYKIKSNDSVYIKQNEHKAKLILLEKENNGFYTVLREKLHWGVSPVT